MLEDISAAFHEIVASPDMSTGITVYSQVVLSEGDIRLVESFLRSTGVVECSGCQK